MSRYKLKAKSLEKALELSLNSFSSKASKILIPTVEALGYILAEDIVADRDLPPYNIAFYDGYAVRSKDTSGASPSKPVKLKLLGYVFKEGEQGQFKIEPGTTVYVSANSPLPEGADSIVRLEYTEQQDNVVLIKREVEPNQDIVLKGEDIKTGDIILSKGKVLRPQDIALLLEIEKYRIFVYRKPKIGIVAVGSELLERVDRGRIYPDNYSIFIQKLLSIIGLETHHLGIIPDDPKKIKDIILGNIDKLDVLLLVGGASIGLNDITGSSLEKLGEVIFHGTNLSPGKVSGLVMIKDKPVFLVPGHVGSAISCIYNFVIPLISKIFFDSNLRLPSVYAELTHDIDVKAGSYTFRTVSLIWKNNKLYARPHLKRLGGSTLLTIFTEAQGYILVPPGERPKAGDIIKVTLFSDMEASTIRNK